jgi:archaellum biogenesis ATPase FlaH/Zn ribbon nucleic-acid-binding protein
MKEVSRFIGHYPCPECNSVDNLSVYEKEDDRHNTYKDAYCFGCQTYLNPKRTAHHLEESYEYRKPENDEDFNLEDLKDIQQLECRGWRERKIRKEINEKYGVRCEFDSETGEIVARYYPSTRDMGSIVGYKKRTLPKQFTGIGNTKATNELFGQSIHEAGQSYLCITTGEEDALALAQTLHTNKGGREFWTPVVSVTAGDGSILKQIKANFDYINSFNKVVLFFDMDESGQRYVEDAAKLLNPGKAYIAKLPLKDASEMVKSDRTQELKSAFWKANRYSPVDVTTLGQLWDEFEQSVEDDIIPLPPEFGQLAELMGGGPAAGEVTVIGALTSVGKSTVLNNMVYHVARNTPKKVGLMYLESSPREIVRSFLSIHTEQNLALQKYSDMDMGKLKVQFDELIGDDSKIVTVNHNGSFTSVDEMFEKIRWMVKVAGCEVVVIDPLQAAVPSNENSVIDNFMDSLLKLAKETNASIIVVSHMKKPDDDKPHGVSEYSLKGSSAINQIAFNTFLLSRDKISSDERVRNSTKITLVKCRRTGLTGEGGWLKYDPTSAKIIAGYDPCVESEVEEIDSAFAEGAFSESPPWEESPAY